MMKTGRDYIGVKLALTDKAFREMKHGPRCVVLPPGTHWRQCKVGAEFELTEEDFEAAALHPESHIKSGAWRVVPKRKPVVKDKGDDKTTR